jgi:hypothetical protein
MPTSPLNQHRLCLVAPGNHSPVLGIVSEHVMAMLQQRWTMSSVYVAVRDDPFDSTLIGFRTPTLAAVPSLTESSTSSGLSRSRRLRRHFLRERPDVVLVDVWGLSQLAMLPVLSRAAASVGAKVVLRLCGRLDDSLGYLRSASIRRSLARVDLVITQGYVPRWVQSCGRPTWDLPEWKTEERQVDPSSVDVVAFLPSADSSAAEALLRAFDGLSAARVTNYRLHLLQREGDQLSRIRPLVSSIHHSNRVDVLTDWFSDSQLDRRLSTSGVVVVFDPNSESRALDAASHLGLPVVIVGASSQSGPIDAYCGAAMSNRDPASLLAAIERANLARKYRYPAPSDLERGADLLTTQLSELIGATPTRSTVPVS